MRKENDQLKKASEDLDQKFSKLDSLIQDLVNRVHIPGSAKE
jgi:hypothetical protein